MAGVGRRRAGTGGGRDRGVLRQRTRRRQGRRRDDRVHGVVMLLLLRLGQPGQVTVADLAAGDSHDESAALRT